MSTAQSTPTRSGSDQGAPPAASSAVSAPNEVQAFLGALIELQCRTAHGVAGVIYLAGSDQRRAGIAARTAQPGAEELLQPPTLARLERLGAEACSRAGDAQAWAGVETLAITRPGDLYGAERSHKVLCATLGAGGPAQGAAIVVLGSNKGVDPSEALERLVLSCAKFEAFLWRQHALGEVQQKVLLRETLELLDAAQQGANARAMGALICHELARRFGCTRVSIGLIDGPASRIRLAAISGSDQVDRKSEAAGVIEAAMEECALQDIELVYPAPPAANDDPAARRVLRAHELLSQRQGPASILSLPLRVEGDLVGVVLLERAPNDPFPAAAASLLRLVAEFIGPAMWTRRLADRGLLAVTRDRTREVATMVVGPRHTGWKLGVLLLVIGLIAAAVVPIPRRVSAEAEMRATVSRTIVPPFVGYLDEVLVEPGSKVRAGEVVARMDVSVLEMRLAELTAREASLSVQRDEARNRGEAGKAQEAEASIEEIRAQMRTFSDQLDKAEIRSPIDGVVSRGDLRDFIGARVEPSQALLEIVNEGRLAVVRVEEQDIDRVHVGQEGHLMAKARPGVRIPIRVIRMNPAAEPVEGANVYLVEAEILGEDVAWLRPGETGLAKLDAGSTTVMQAVVGPLVDAARMRWWW